MQKTLLTYLSVKKLPDETVTLDDETLRIIRKEYTQLNGDNDPDDEQLKEDTLKKLINKLSLSDDPTNLEYLDICVSESSDYDAKLEIIAKFKGSVQFLESPTAEEFKQQKTDNDSHDKNVELLSEITCIIHKKLNKPEVNKFMDTFLFQQIQQENNQSSGQESTVDTGHPYHDGQLHSLPKGSMIDLFIREQMNERGIITFIGSRTKFRLVESISLTDEFDSWTFDHFRNIFDLWLTRNIDNKECFPSQWKLSNDALINYVIDDRLTGDDDHTSRHIEHPRTKSLEIFIRDICVLEDNKEVYDVWMKALGEENIKNYSHLTNLNQTEWRRIKKLSMNALKTIKCYVDREKQTVEERKPINNKDEEQHDKTSDMISELRANLHMIKLYFIRQLETKYHMKQIPKLDAECVKLAFEEMCQEGYEEDGLFDDMKLFFQPLTVTDDELTINGTLLLRLNQEQEKEKKILEDEIQILTNSLDEKRTKKLEQSEYSEELEQMIKKMNEEGVNDFEDNRLELLKTERLLHQKKKLSWLRKDDERNRKIVEIKKEIDIIQKQIIEYNNDLQDVETKTIDKENLLQIIKTNLASHKRRIDKKLVKPHRGFIMYGPPGTGKSVIMSKLAKKIGIAMLGPPLAAGELERPLVGQSEAVILDLCIRGNRIPHLACCVSIDEIDSLAPRRDEDSSEGKVAKISVLLSVIEGIKDVSNLMFFSATNRLHMMDEAFLRRMSGKFFVGRPSSDARKRILNEIPTTILQPNIKEKLAIATTNFSGAALKALTSAITVHYISQQRPEKDNKIKNYEITEEDTLILADRTARQYQLFLGLDTLPRLLLHNLDILRQLNEQNQTFEGFHLQKTCQFTGKIIISLHDRCVRIETNERFDKKRTIEDKLRKTEQSLQQLLERITSYGNDRNVQLLQLIDLNLLSSKGAYDEKKIFEILKERYDECMEYKRSMIIYDLDSLIGVNRSESESSMGISISSSVANQSIYRYVISRFREAKIEDSRTDKKLNNERWAIAIVRDPFLLKKFTHDVDFTRTKEQKKQEDEESNKSTNVLICVKCRDFYMENENRMGSCNYHDGFVYDNLALDMRKYTRSAAIDELNREEFLTIKDKMKGTERPQKHLKYICCDAPVQAGGMIGGCKKEKHGFGDKKMRRDAEQVLNREIIKIWEDECFENIEYNQRRENLLAERSGTKMEGEQR